VVYGRDDQPRVGSVNQLRGLRFTQRSGSAETPRMRERYPWMTIQEYPSTLEELQAIASGQADATIGNSALLSYLARRHSLGNLRVLAPSDDPAREYRVAFHPQAAALQPLFDRAFASIPEGEKDQIRRRWIESGTCAARPG
jgi:ABC-type amino acid transport substrate-binding protein